MPEFEFETPEPNWVDLSLAPEVRELKSAGEPPAERLDGWISLGTPVVVALDANNATDEDLIRVLERRPKNVRYHLVHLACSFRPPHGQEFANAWLEVKLLRSDGAASDPPIAWSMRPRNVRDTEKVTTTTKLDANLKLLDLKVGAGISEKTEGTISEVYVEALNEQQSDPTWEFSRTSKTTIRGSHRLQLVVQSPRSVASRGELKLRASVARKKYLLWTYTTDVPGAAHIAFQLPSPP